MVQTLLSRLKSLLLNVAKLRRLTCKTILIVRFKKQYIVDLIYGLEATSEFRFPEILNVYRDEIFVSYKTIKNTIVSIEGKNKNSFVLITVRLLHEWKFFFTFHNKNLVENFWSIFCCFLCILFFWTEHCILIINWLLSGYKFSALCCFF